MESNLQRQLKIKLGSLKRLHKEYLSYQKEKEKQMEKIESMKVSNGDEYSIKKQIEVLKETENMLPNCQGRLSDNLIDFQGWIEENKEQEAIKDQLDDAYSQITIVKEFLDSLNTVTTTTTDK